MQTHVGSYWRGSTWFRKQEPMFEEAKRHNHEIIIERQYFGGPYVNKKGVYVEAGARRLFGSYKTLEDFEKCVKGVHDPHCFALIPERAFCVSLFDIEYYGKSESPAHIIQTVIDRWFQFLRIKSLVNEDDLSAIKTRCIVATSSREKLLENGIKVFRESYHIYLPMLVFENCSEVLYQVMKAFHTWIEANVADKTNDIMYYTKAPNEVATVYDPVIYTKNRTFRMVGSSKPDDPTHTRFVLQSPQDATLRDTWISFSEVPNFARVVIKEKDIEAIRLENEQNERNEKAKVKTSSKKRKRDGNINTLAKDLAIDHTENDRVQQEITQMLRDSGDQHSYLGDVTLHNGLCSVYGRTNGSRTCPWGHEHNSNNFYLTITSKGVVEYHCFGSDRTHPCHKKKVVFGKLSSPVHIAVSHEKIFKYIRQILVGRNIGWTIEDVLLFRNVSHQTIEVRCRFAWSINGCHHPEDQHIVVNLTKEHVLVATCCNGRHHTLPFIASFETAFQVEKYDSPLVRTFTNTMSLEDCKVLVVKSAMGTGKTIEIVNLVRECISKKPKARILCVGCRIQFDITLHGALGPEFGFRLYNDKTINDKNEPMQEWMYADRLIVQFESLHHLFRHSVEYFDLVILDEFKSILECMVSAETNRFNMAKNCRTLEGFIRAPNTKTLATDQDNDQFSVSVLQHIISNNHTSEPEGRVYVHQNLHVNGYGWNFVQHEVLLVERMLDLLRQNKRVVFVSGSKRKAEQFFKILEQKIPNKHGRMYHKDSLPEHMDDFLNLNAAWMEQDYVFYTPKVTVGASFTVPQIFHKIFVYACDQSVNFRIIAQMIGRVRDPVDRTIDCYIHQSQWTQIQPVNLDEIREQINTDCQHARDILETLYDTKWINAPGAKNISQCFVRLPSLLGIIYENTLRDRNLARNDYLADAIHHLSGLGHSYSFDNQNDVNPELLDLLKEVKEDQKKQELMEFDQAPMNLSRDEIQCIEEKENNQRTPQEKMCLLKFYYQLQWNVPIDAAHYQTYHPIIPQIKAAKIYLLYQNEHDLNAFLRRQLSLLYGKKSEFLELENHKATQKIVWLYQLAKLIGLKHPMDQESIISRQVIVDNTQKIVVMETQLSSVVRREKPIDPTKFKTVIYFLKSMFAQILTMDIVRKDKRCKVYQLQCPDPVHGVPFLTLLDQYQSTTI